MISPVHETPPACARLNIIVRLIIVLRKIPQFNPLTAPVTRFPGARLPDDLYHPGLSPRGLNEQQLFPMKVGYSKDDEYTIYQ
jgi:hypothetical protein